MRISQCLADHIMVCQTLRWVRLDPGGFEEVSWRLFIHLVPFIAYLCGSRALIPSPPVTDGWGQHAHTMHFSKEGGNFFRHSSQEIFLGKGMHFHEFSTRYKNHKKVPLNSL